MVDPEILGKRHELVQKVRRGGACSSFDISSVTLGSSGAASEGLLVPGEPIILADAGAEPVLVTDEKSCPWLAR